MFYQNAENLISPFQKSELSTMWKSKKYYYEKWGKMERINIVIQLKNTLYKAELTLFLIYTKNSK